MFYDEILNKVGIPFEKLEEEERKTLIGWLKNLSNKRLTIEDIKVYIKQMADGVAQELCKSELPKKEDIFLKARLKNYLLLLDYLTSPEKAKRSLENYLKNIEFK